VSDANTTSNQSVTRRRHSSIVPQSLQSTAKTATRRKAVSVDEVRSSLPCKQPVVELSPLSESKISRATAPASAPTVVCNLSFEILQSFCL